MITVPSYVRVTIVDGSCDYKEFCQAIGCYHRDIQKQVSSGFYGEINLDPGIDEDKFIEEISKKFPNLILKLETEGYLYGFYQSGKEISLKKNLNMELCSGRHSIPQAIDGAIFPKTVCNVTRPDKLEESAEEILKGKTSYGDLQEITSINLYATGLTVALIAVLNICRKEDIKVTLWHYDKYSKDYFKQEIK